MPSPFPGMNPYLEQEPVWHDFHERFIPLVAEWIGAQVLPRYFVTIDEHIYIHEPELERPRLVGRGDVLVSEGITGAEHQPGAALLEAPAQVRQPVVDVASESFLEIRDRKDRHLVTVIELLSPSNKKPGRYRDQYWNKCQRILASNTHLVEIDLLRGGPRMPWLDMPPCDYYAVVSRAERRPHAGFWPIPLRGRLPPIAIPLKEGDNDATLDLQQVLHRIYDAAGYQYYIYTSQPEPPLHDESARWAAELIAVH